MRISSNPVLIFSTGMRRSAVMSRSRNGRATAKSPRRALSRCQFPAPPSNQWPLMMCTRLLRPHDWSVWLHLTQSEKGVAKATSGRVTRG